jgi:hypothetical protein
MIDKKWLFFKNQNISASQARFFSSARSNNPPPGGV